MSNRRRFIKQAGALAAAPWSQIAHASGVPMKSNQATPPVVAEKGSITLENEEIRLVIGAEGWARSLVHKPSGQECLASHAREPMFVLTQYRPYDNELQLSYPAKIKHYPAEHIRREGNNLVVDFALVGYEGVVAINVTRDYIAFRLQSLVFKGYTRLRPKRKTPIDEALFVQLPVRDREQLGEWLNVAWDDDVAINLLATDHHAQMDAQSRHGYRLFQAGTVREVKLEGVGAALIVTAPSRLLDRIAQVEKDFNLPRGVESRRRKEARYSYYEILKITPEDADRHVRFARMGGFRTVEILYRAFSKCGHFNFLPEYPNGIEDLRAITGKIRAAGMIPGIHIHYNKVDKADPYVTPLPDPRLNVSRIFTLAKPLDTQSRNIAVEENPRLCRMDDGRRFLRIASELIEYEGFTTTRPYEFHGCRRGALGTPLASCEAGAKIGQLDVDDETSVVRITQDTDMQQDVARHLAKIYQEAGFRFLYYDGAEDVPPPYWFTVSRAQSIVYNECKPAALWGEGACKSHFSWHILTRGNAFDVFEPEVMKAAVRAYPAAEVPRLAKDFTRINFGWIGYWAPNEQTIGTQPDMLEYVTSRAAAWDCPVSLVGDLPALEAHPRTPDNLEVIKRWEDVRAEEWLNPDQKRTLKDLSQEHTLLINERGDFELVPYEQIQNVGESDRPGRAFVFDRAGVTFVVFWHTSGEGEIEVPLRGNRMRLMRELGKPLKFESGKQSVRLPLSRKMYLECAGVSRQQAIAAFQNARIIGT